MSIGAISANSSAMLQHLQSTQSTSASAAAKSASPLGSAASQVSTLDSDHDGDTDFGGSDTNDGSGKGQFINVKA